MQLAHPRLQSTAQCGFVLHEAPEARGQDGVRVGRERAYDGVVAAQRAGVHGGGVRHLADNGREVIAGHEAQRLAGETGARHARVRLDHRVDIEAVHGRGLRAGGRPVSGKIRSAAHSTADRRT